MQTVARDGNLLWNLSMLMEDEGQYSKLKQKVAQ
jgi:hypothetical protein